MCTSHISKRLIILSTALALRIQIRIRRGSWIIFESRAIMAWRIREIGFTPCHIIRIEGVRFLKKNKGYGLLLQHVGDT